VPHPKALQAILRKITETLATELASPTEVAPSWSDYEWRIAQAVAAMHGASPLLSRRLRWRGPDGWVRFLAEQRSHTATRHARIEELLRLIDQHARNAGIAIVALKGVALHAMALYESGDRPMADIDLLVRPDDANSAVRMLEALGFHESSASWKERAFTPIVVRTPCGLGEHSSNDLKVELHERICERLLDDASCAARGRVNGLQITTSHSATRSRAAVVANDGGRLGCPREIKSPWGMFMVGCSSVGDNVTLFPRQNSRLAP
jgi:hypothetical protein